MDAPGARQLLLQVFGLRFFFYSGNLTGMRDCWTNVSKIRDRHHYFAYKIPNKISSLALKLVSHLRKKRTFFFFFFERLNILLLSRRIQGRFTVDALVSRSNGLVVGILLLN